MMVQRFTGQFTDKPTEVEFRPPPSSTLHVHCAA